MVIALGKLVDLAIFLLGLGCLRVCGFLLGKLYAFLVEGAALGEDINILEVTTLEVWGDDEVFSVVVSVEVFG